MILLTIRVYYYLNACIQACGKAAYFAEALNAENANTIIPYEMLSNGYKSEISSEEYINANTPQDILNLYMNPVFQQNIDRQVDITLSTEGYKKIPEGYILVDEQWHYIKHEIDVLPDLLTLKPQIIRWHIVIDQTDVPTTSF